MTNKTTTQHYVVTLHINLGDGETYSDHFIEADSESSAELQAFRNESYNDANREWDGSSDGEWSDGNFIYAVHETKVVDPADVEILKKYL